jgi:hypothetical protein
MTRKEGSDYCWRDEKGSRPGEEIQERVRQILMRRVRGKKYSYSMMNREDDAVFIYMRDLFIISQTRPTINATL